MQTGSVLLGLSENSESVLAFKSNRATHIVLRTSVHLSIHTLKGSPDTSPSILRTSDPLTGGLYDFIVSFRASLD